MLDLQGYHNCSVGDDGGFRIDDRKGLSADAFRFKVCDFVRSAYVVDGAGTLNAKGKIRRKKVNVKCRIIYTFSPERRAGIWQILKTGSPGPQGCPGETAHGKSVQFRMACIDSNAEGSSTECQKKRKYRAVGLKEDVITERRTIAGYAAVVYTQPAAREGEKTQELADLQVLSTYHKLVTIEDSFRTIKSTFSIRPVHVRLKSGLRSLLSVRPVSNAAAVFAGKSLRLPELHSPSGGFAAALKRALVLPMPAPGGRIQQLLNLLCTLVFMPPSLTARESMKVKPTN